MKTNRIKELRKLRKMTQVQLANAVGAAQGSIQKLENGEITLDIKWMSSLSEILDVKPYELLPQEWQPTAETVDTNDLGTIIEIVETHLQQANKILSPEHKAKLIVLLLEIAKENPANENLNEQISNTINVYTRAVSA